MIPKIIHYIWFGGNPYPEKVQYCMETWKKYLPDYEFKLWNEDNFNIDICTFVKEAYEEKKYAFVSDYVRVYALYHEGGVYLDTDIEVRKSLNPLMNNRVVLGVDEGGYLTAFMASEKEHPYFGQLLEKYNRMSFKQNDGSLNMEVNNSWMQEILTEYGYKIKNELQELSNGIVVYPCDYFHAKSLTSGKLCTTGNSYTIHHHTLLWIPVKTRIIRFIRMKVLVPIIGADNYTRITKKIKGSKSTI